VNIYSLSSVKYSQLIIVLFIVVLFWVTVLWIMRLMANGLLRPLVVCRLVGLIKATRPKRMRN
jgi:hypothetical protein